MANETDETPKLQPESGSPELESAPETATEAAVEAEAPAESEAVAENESEAEKAEDEAETEVEAEDGPEPEPEDPTEPATGPEFNPQPRPPAKLERLQKILAAAGVASRRRAEELIEQGRVQVNGKIVTELGTKADSGRDHIRVDGKLLQGAERLRYFILNKPKGFVTTVRDPEGRPTVMQFFDKMKERLYPVGRLDYMSEGLLVVTNDGELANKLTKASSGVEKTYLVKVAGQPTETELDILRGGVAIERGKPGSGQVRTSPARIRQVRQGDNPWYEVVLIEGRNRELRKMFEEVGHFVEKIRRVGYGPLVLDQEPGNLRELEPEELELLRKAAEGKLRTPKAKELRRRNALDAQLPTLAPKASRPRSAKPMEAGPEQMRSAGPARTGPARTGDYRPSKSFGADRPSRSADSFAKRDDKPFRSARPAGRPSDQPSARPTGRPSDRRDSRPPERPSSRYAADSTGKSLPAPERPAPDRTAYDRTRTGPARPGSAGTGRTGAGRPFTAKPTWKKSERAERSERPAFKRPAPPRREAPAFDEDFGPVRPPNLHIEEIQPSDRPSTTRSSAPRSSYSHPSAPRSDSDRPKPSRSGFEASASSPRSGAAKPFRGEGGLARPFTTSSGKPRAGGARPSSKAGRPAKPGMARSGSGPRAGSDSRPSYGAKRPYDAKSAGPAKRPFRNDAGEGSSRSSRPAGARPPTSSKPYTPRAEGASDYRPSKAKPYPKSASRAERKAGPGWKPKTSFSAPGKPAAGSRSKPKPGGYSKSSFKPKPGGKRLGGASGRKKRS
jgi:23S rRNA pseudouridine2605 synthase